MRRELWHVRQIEEHEDLEQQKTGSLRGEVADLEEFEDGKTSVVVADKQRACFAIVDIPSEKADDLAPGDPAKVSRGHSIVLKRRPRDREIEQ